MFKLSPPTTDTGAWTETVVYAFAGGAAGETPSGLVADENGSLYGMTVNGGSAGVGIVFKLTNTRSGYRESVLHVFSGGADGGQPNSSLLLDAHGALYGEAGAGGSRGAGVVFKLCPPAGRSSAWTERVVYSFGATPNDGKYPVGGLTAGPGGALYGATTAGGGYPSSTASFYGTIFKLTPLLGTADTWTESVLYAFGSRADGGQSALGGLILGPNGTIFGATGLGGAYTNGTVYELLPPVRGRPGYEHRVIASMGNYANPTSPMILDGSGNLYLATEQGRSSNDGSILMLTPPAGGVTSYAQMDLYDFKGSPDGATPQAGLLRVGSKGFGTTAGGGRWGWGTIYELSKY